MPSPNLFSTAPIDNAIAQQIRQDFPILGGEEDARVVYLDNGASTQKPQAVIDAITDYYTTSNANIHRGVYDLSQRATEAYDQARARVQRLINARSEREIIFTRGATESLNLLAATVSAIIPEGRDEIVLTELEHHANLVPWQQLAQREGYKLRFIPITDDYDLDYDQARAIISERTALVAFPQVSNVLGLQVEAGLLVGLAKSVDALSVIDAAQSIPHQPVDVQGLACDFLAFSSHKLCGPTGMGVLYGRENLLAQLPPYQTGGDMIASVSYTEATWNELPMKFEAGTPNIAGAVGLGAAAEYLMQIGLERIHAWEQELLSQAVDALSEIEGIRMFLPPAGKRGGILSFELAGVHPHDIASLLNDDRIAVRAGHHCAQPLMGRLGVPATTRASFYLYNTVEDVARLAESLARIRKLFEQKSKARISKF